MVLVTGSAHLFSIYSLIVALLGTIDTQLTHRPHSQGAQSIETRDPKHKSIKLWKRLQISLGHFTSGNTKNK